MNERRFSLGAPCLNPRLNGLSPSATVASQERSNRLLAEGRRIFKMGLGQSPFPVPDSVIEALRANAFQKDYLPVKGLGALRETLAARHTQLFGEACNRKSDAIGKVRSLFDVIGRVSFVASLCRPFQKAFQLLEPQKMRV